MAENTQKKAEIQYFLSKELEAFWTNESSTKMWVEGMQKQADSMGRGTQGGKATSEERLNTAKVKYNAFKIILNIVSKITLYQRCI